MKDLSMGPLTEPVQCFMQAILLEITETRLQTEQKQNILQFSVCT